MEKTNRSGTHTASLGQYGDAQLISADQEKRVGVMPFLPESTILRGGQAPSRLSITPTQMAPSSSLKRDRGSVPPGLIDRMPVNVGINHLGKPAGDFKPGLRQAQDDRPCWLACRHLIHGSSPL